MNENPIWQTNESPIAVVLINLGTPDAPTPQAIRRYLSEFLSDPRVVEIPKFIWWWILNLIIIPLRASRVAKLYEKIWCDGDSPMRTILHNQATQLQTALIERFDQQQIGVIDAMTYGSPSIKTAFDEVARKNIQKVLIIPLFPQYSGTTTAAVYDKVARVLTKHRHVPEIRYVKQYCDEASYLDALAGSIRRHWGDSGQLPERLVFSFHGIPKKYARNGDPYPQQCHFTASETAKRLNITDQEWICTFQSRFGPSEWVKPYTLDTVRDLAQKGVKRIDVVCPAFSADCLETLEEIAIQNQEAFLDAGGACFRYIPALNTNEDHIDCLAKLVIKHISGWI